MALTFEILTDSSCDLSYSFAQELQIHSIPLCVTKDGEDIWNHLDGDPAAALDMHEFYNALRYKAITSTTAANPATWCDAMEAILSQGKDLLVLAFSSGLSGTYASCVQAAQEMKEKYPERTLLVADTLCASLGQGLLVYHAAQRRKEGMTIHQVHQWVEDHKLNLCHWFTVDDLMFLKRGGRVSAATAVAGTLLKIKPVMHVDNEGHLIKVTTARGRKASIEALAERMAHTAIEPEKQVVFISHGDCLEEAKYLADLVREKLHPVDVVIGYVGPVIGAHSGPGTLALFFLGTER